MATQPKPEEQPIAADETELGLTVTVEGVNDDDTPARDYEAEARQHGWAPKEEFKGDPARWVDAETFTRRADEVMPLLRKENERIKRELADVKKQTRRIVDHFETDRARLLAEIEGKIEDAVADGDAGEVDRLRKEEKKLTKAEDRPQVTREEAMEALDTFRDANPWYDRANLASASEQDINARLYADRMTEKHLAKTAEMAPADFYAMIQGLVEERYPAIRNKPARPKPAADVAPATTGRQPGVRGRSFNDLPVEAQRLADKWIKSGLIKDRASYVASYNW